MKERAWHATIANDASVGIEISSPGAAPLIELNKLSRWYTEVDARDSTRQNEKGKELEQTSSSDEESTHKSKEQKTNAGILEHSTHNKKRIRLKLPRDLEDKEKSLANFVAEPMAQKVIQGCIHGQTLVQYDFTREQYKALACLIATLRKSMYGS